MTSPADDELHWLAFRYSAGEMSAAEEEQFELRLADDQHTREMVEQAVELREAVRLAAAEAAIVRPTDPATRRIAFVRGLVALAATAAVVLVIVGYSIWRGRPARDPAIGSQLDVALQEASVALEWAALRERQEDDSAAEASSWLEVNEFAESDTGADLPAIDPAGSELPMWLLTAVADETNLETP